MFPYESHSKLNLSSSFTAENAHCTSMNIDSCDINVSIPTSFSFFPSCELHSCWHGEKVSGKASQVLVDAQRCKQWSWKWNGSKYERTDNSGEKIRGMWWPRGEGTERELQGHGLLGGELSCASFLVSLSSLPVIFCRKWGLEEKNTV